MLDVIKKYYPLLYEKYIRLFKDGTEMPQYYQQAFKKKMKEMGAAYGIEMGILNAARKLSSL